MRIGVASGRSTRSAARKSRIDVLEMNDAPGSADPVEALRVALPSADIDVGALRDHGMRLFIERARRARGRADDQGILGKLLAFGHQRAGADERIAADARAIEQN